ncbi:MAG: hypothetical protein JJ934_18420 [Pseudomonadales bacterium]|nr:hypothetical protein [Pseudomonadales bacterium]
MGKWQEWVPQSLLICFSILLAFWLDDWGEERQIRDRTHVALCNVKRELQENYVKLTEDYEPRHKGLLAYVDSTIEQLSAEPPPAEPISMIDRPLFMEGLEDTAWDLAMETGYLLHADFTLAAEMSKVYGIQNEFIAMNIPRILDLLYWRSAGIRETDLETQLSLRTLLAELVSQEEYAIFRYERLLARSDLSELACEIEPEADQGS